MPKTDQNTPADAELSVADLTAEIANVQAKTKEKQRRYSILGVKEIHGTSTTGDTAERNSLLRDLSILHDQEAMLNEMLAQAQRREEIAMVADKRNELGQLSLEYLKRERAIEQLVRTKLVPVVEALTSVVGEVREAQRDSYEEVRTIMGRAPGHRNFHMREIAGNARVLPSLESALAAVIRDLLLRHDVLSLDAHVALKGHIPELSIEDAIAADVEMHVNFMTRFWSSSDLLEHIQDEATT